MTSQTCVLVPGMGSTAAMWIPVVQELALQGVRSYPVELPGHGFDTRFPEGYLSPQDEAVLATAPSPIAGLTLDDYSEHVAGIVHGVAEHGPVTLVGHSLGGNVVTRVANIVPDLLSAIVYCCAYCCVNSSSVMTYAPRSPDPDGPLARARSIAWVGDPRQTGASRTNPRTGDADILDAQRRLMMADLDPERVPAALGYALQPDEPIRAVIGEARVDPVTWGRVPRAYIRTTQDEVVPPDVQDRMIAEADALTPDNRFTVYDLEASHFVPLSRPRRLAEVLAAAGRPT
jgi:pimeloyl-ACP methyl ester carboxylesterase